MMELREIAIFHSPLADKFGIPRQSGLVPELRGEVCLLPPYDKAEAVKGLEDFDYIWLVWGFSLNKTSGTKLTVRPPRLGGNSRVGVFASRSPFRPNPIGLSCVKLISIHDGRIEVSGADLADGTPIYDIKPYVRYADSHPDAKSGFVDGTEWKPMEVIIPDGLGFTDLEIAALKGILSQDPRPQYQEDEDRVYGMSYASRNVLFRCKGNTIVVLSAEKC